MVLQLEKDEEAADQGILPQLLLRQLQGFLICRERMAKNPPGSSAYPALVNFEAIQVEAEWNQSTNLMFKNSMLRSLSTDWKGVALDAKLEGIKFTRSYKAQKLVRPMYHFLCTG